MEALYLGPEIPQYDIKQLQRLPQNMFWGFAGMTKRQMERTLFMFDAYQVRPCVDLAWLNKMIGREGSKAYDGHYHKPAFFRLKAGYPFSILEIQDTEIAKFEPTEYPVGNSVQGGVYDLLNRYALDVWPATDQFGSVYIFAVWDEELLKAQQPAYIKVPGGKYYSFNDQMYAPAIYSLDAGPIRRSAALKDLEKAVREENKRRLEHPEQFATSYRGDDKAEDQYWDNVDNIAAKARQAEKEKFENTPMHVRTREERKELKKKIRAENKRLKKLDKMHQRERNFWL